MSESPLEKLRRLEQERSEELDERSKHGSKSSSKRSGIIGTAIVALLFLLTKGKFIIFFLVTKAKWLFGMLKFGKIFATFSTMWLSIIVYSTMYGWHLAMGIVLLILVHEYGHGIAAKIMKLDVGAPIFIPFFGAVIALKEQPKSTWVEAVIGFGGPLAGMLGGVVVLVVGKLCEPGDFQGLCFVVAWFTFMINYFNLMPVWQLDGARITKPFKAWYWLPGVLVLSFLIYFQAKLGPNVNPFMYFILFLGAIRGVTLYRQERKKKLGNTTDERLVDQITKKDTYVKEYTVKPWQRRASAIAYFGICIVLSFLMVYADKLRPMVE